MEDSPPSTCCTLGIPVSHSPTPASDSEKPTSVTSGPPSHEPFAYYDHESSLWKTCQLTFDSDSTLCLLTLPTWGSMRAGALYEHPTWAPRTSEPDSLSLPTPTTQDAANTGGKAQHDRNSLPLNTLVTLLPTPAAQEPGGTSERFLERKNRDGSQRTDPSHLSHVVQLLPTPGANDSHGGEGPTREARQEQGTGGPMLRDIRHLLPTPTVEHNARNRTSGRKPDAKFHTGVTLQDALWLASGRTTDTLGNPLGESTNLPSNAGNPSPESLHPDQLTIEDA